jgi:hypothetical protein
MRRQLHQQPRREVVGECRRFVVMGIDQCVDFIEDFIWHASCAVESIRAHLLTGFQSEHRKIKDHTW